MTDNEIATNFRKLPEVPMNPHDELLLWHALHRLEVTYWYDVDFNEGRTAHEFFTPDGVKVVGHNRFEGREEIRIFYEQFLWWCNLSNEASITPPIMVADLITECVLSKDNAWRFKSHTLRPVFMSNAPPSMLIAPHFLEQT